MASIDFSDFVATPAGKFHDFHHVQFYVSNALQAATFYCTRLGFHPFAFRGFETGHRDTCTHVVKNGNAIFAFTCSLNPNNEEFGEWLKAHGDGVHDVVFEVDDVHAIYAKAIKEGAVSVMEPTEDTDDDGTIISATVRTYGDTVHTLIQKKDYQGHFLPNYRMVMDDDPVNRSLPPVSYIRVDHVVGNQDWGGMVPAAMWYFEKLGFHQYWSVDETQIHTDYSALRSIVVADESEKILMPINEPARGLRKSQIQEYVEFYGGPGVQHIALSTPDILTTIAALRARGLRFLDVPPKYYVDLRKRLAHSPVRVEEDLKRIEELSILVDFDDQGYLLQIFTKPLEDRPTLFIEIIQRHNNNGFGVGNFKALFESLEREQGNRGNL